MRILENFKFKMHNNYKIMICKFLFFFFCILIYPQDNLKPVNFPVGSNAAAFARNVIFPVEYYTGKVNISIPIYNIQSSTINIPISLSYNSSGIQLNELASWVGLGWNLNAGGAIVRNTKGEPDGYGPLIDIGENFAFTLENFNILRKQFNRELDTAPDEYIVNAPGLSGVFYFDHTDSNKIIFRDFQNTKVKVVANLIRPVLKASWFSSVLGAHRFELIKDDGTRYIFGSDDETLSAYDINLVSSLTSVPTSRKFCEYVSSWHLTEIIPPSGGDKIEFKYKAISSSDYPVSSSESGTEASIGDIDTQLFASDYPEKEMIIEKKYLEKILFKNGEVEFESQNDREDLLEDFKLNKIKVFNGLGVNKKLIQEYTFNYDYYIRQGGSTTTRPPYSYLTRNVLASQNKSLRLKELVNNNLNVKHSFEYNSHPLPLRGTTQQDYWGYINNNSKSLIPRSFLEYTDHSNLVTTYYGNGNREANEDYMKSGILEKITYPEGGYTMFNYEANRYKKLESSIISKSVFAKAYGKGCNYDAGPSVKIVEFDGKNYIEGSGRLLIEFTPGSNGAGGTSRVSYDGSGVKKSEVLAPNPDNSVYQPYSSTINKNFSRGNNVLSAYEYRSGKFGIAGCPMSSITAFWEENGPDIVKEILVGGLRIKEIRIYKSSDSSTPSLFKKYEYEEENVIDDGKINSNQYRQILGEGITDTHFFSNAIFNNGIGGGPSITYGKITEKTIDDQNNTSGKIEYTYENISPLKEIYPPKDFTIQPSSYALDTHTAYTPYRTISSAVLKISNIATYINELWNQGSLKRTDFYKLENNKYKIIKSVINNYNVIKRKIIPYNIVFNTTENKHNEALGYDFPTIDSNPLLDYYSGLFYYIKGSVSLGKKLISSSSQIVYDDNEQPTIKSEIQYFYNNSNHYKLTSQTATFPDNTVQETTYRYAHEKGNQYLIDKNMVGIPLQTTISKNNLGISSIETKYPVSQTEANTKTEGLALPISIISYGSQIQGTSSPSNTELTYDKYDDKGNVLQYSEKGLKPTVIIWGYNKTQPIAKIEGAKYDDIKTLKVVLDAITASDTDAGQGTDTSEQSLITSLDALRTNSSLSNYLITTYTYDPLIGVTSITPPSGIREIYKYDKANRLEKVVDINGKIIKEYQYNYKQ